MAGMIGGSVHVVALGANTPIGRDAYSTASAVRAGISGFCQHPFMVDTASEPMMTAQAPWLDIDLAGVERFEALLFPAMDEALEPLIHRSGQQPRVALALGLPGARPGLPAGLESRLLAAVRARYSGLFAAATAFPCGHAAGALGMDAAARTLAQGRYDVGLVAAVDSYLEPDTLEWLEANDQIHGAGALNNAWGFVPGEAAGAVLLTTGHTASRLGCQSLGDLLGVGNAIEENRIKTDTVCIGQGLTAAFRSALARLPSDARVSDIYCDMNGEPYRADEFGFATVRTAEGFVDCGEFEAPADCWGDVGAASGTLLTILAVIASQKSYAKGPLSLIWVSSESGERSAALFHFENRQ